jgi:uncharacterized protein YaiI (UPF0178 family)
MLILFDFENIQNCHYKRVKAFLIQEFGKEEWQNAKKIGAVCYENIDTCLPDWNTAMMIYQVHKEPEAADNKLVELARLHKSRCYVVVSSDRGLSQRVYDAVTSETSLYDNSKTPSKAKEVYQVLQVRSRLLLDRVMMSDQYDPHYDLY